MASAGAGPFPAAATAAAAVAGAPAGSVFVKRAGDALARFAEVEIFGADTVTRLAERASLKRSWGVDAAYVDLFLVPDGLVEVVQRNPAREADVLVDTNLCLATVLLAEAGIRDRSCLLARLSSPPAAAPGECARAARRLLSCLPSRGAGGDVREIPLRSSRRSPISTLSFLSPIFCSWRRWQRWRRRQWQHRRRRSSSWQWRRRRHCGSGKVSR